MKMKKEYFLFVDYTRGYFNYAIGRNYKTSFVATVVFNWFNFIHWLRIIEIHEIELANMVTVKFSNIKPEVKS